MSDVGEHALIDRITSRLTMPSWVTVGPGDDAAVIEPPRGELEVLTTDAVVEGVHFDRRFVPPEAIGHRALAVNLSDLAAMGAEPRAALLSLIVPGDIELTAIDSLIDGLLALATRHKVALIGGNITRSTGPLIVDVTAIGSVRRRRALTRGGARPGDDLYVTGVIGGAVVGLSELRHAAESGRHVEARASETRYLRPEPRVRAGLLLSRNRAATSCIDLSDGLADGVRQLSSASGVGIKLDGTAVPLGPGVREYHQAQGIDPLMAVLAGGDDYELLFTARPRNKGRLRSARREMGDLPITKIGVITKEPGMVLDTETGTRELPTGFEHFR